MSLVLFDIDLATYLIADGNSALISIYHTRHSLLILKPAGVDE